MKALDTTGARRCGSERGTRRRLLIGTVLLALLAGACASEVSDDTTGTSQSSTTTSLSTTSTMEETTTTVSPSTTTTEAEATGLVVYFMLEDLSSDPPGPFLVPVYREVSISDDPATSALDLLLAGPSADEAAGTPAMNTAIPASTELLGVDVAGGLATVDLTGEFDDGGGSFSMFARLAQVVYTLTRLPGIDEVAFEIDGHAVGVFSSEGIELDGPQHRDDYYDLLPPIFVDSPAWGEPITSPVLVGGLSNVFEAVSQLMLTDDDGEPLAEVTVMASCGTGCWGDWAVEIAYEVDRDQFGALIVWEYSAKDGSRIHIREYPVELR